MTLLIASLCLAVAPPHPWDEAARIDDLFQTWASARKEFRSLQVAYTTRTTDRVFRTETVQRATLVLIQTDRGDLLGSLEVREVKNGKMAIAWEVMLRGDRVYLLDHQRKEASHFRPEKGLVRLAARWLNPALGLLDREYARTQYDHCVARQDDHYTYIDLTPRRVRGGLHTQFSRGRVVSFRNEGIPSSRGVPRQLWHELHNGNEVLIDVTRWRLNDPDAPKADSFRWPEGRPGWKVAALPRFEDDVLLKWLDLGE